MSHYFLESLAYVLTLAYPCFFLLSSTYFWVTYFVCFHLRCTYLEITLIAMSHSFLSAYVLSSTLT